MVHKNAAWKAPALQAHGSIQHVTADDCGGANKKGGQTDCIAAEGPTQSFV